MKNLSDFTGLYSLSKTLRFELVPKGKTLEHIEKKGFLAQDEHRAESYQEVKKIIDDYHKAFIEKALKDFNLKFESDNKNDSLEDYFFLYMQRQKDDNLKKKFEDVQAKLRKQVAERFEKDSLFKDQFKRLFAKELIKEDLKTFVKDEKDCELVSEFESFTTYFTGFHENRKNMYSAEEKSTAIAYRLIHENLPKFIDNINSFEKAKATSVAENLPQLYKALKSYLKVSSIDKIFTLAAYSDFLTQTQIEVYNKVIGGDKLDETSKIKGLNEYINLYNQQQTDRTKRLPKLKPLYKQILSDRNTISWLPEEFKSDKEVLESIETCYREIHEHVLYKQKEGEHSLIGLLGQIKEFDVNKIYLRNDTGITDISQKMFGHWGVIQKAIETKYEKDYPKKNKESQENFEKRKEKYFKAFDSISIGFINECLAALGEDYNKNVENFFSLLGKEVKDNGETKNLFEKIEENYKNVETLLKTEYQGSGLAQDKVAVEKIKLLLDNIKALQWFVKPLLGKGNEADKDEKFYGEITELWKTLDQITPLYNKVRNYMTKKPYSEEKMKLNFENPEFLGGWPIDREIATSGVIFKDDNNFFLGVLDKKFKSKFKNLPKPQNIEDTFLKMNYLQAADPSKDVQNLMIINGVTVKKNGRKEKEGEFIGENLQLEKLKNEYLPEHINNIRKIKSYSKLSTTYKKEDLISFIDYYKERTIEYFKNFNFEFKKSEKYSDFSDFTDHINQQAYQLYFSEVSKNYINQLVEEGKLYLFQIYNKDFSPHSKGTPNMHTLYWKMLFDPENLKNVVYKLNGQAEVFYRKSSIKQENTVIHPAKQALVNKNGLNQKKQSTFEYNIIKDKRYTLDKFQFHVPITMNFKGIGLNNVNPKVNQFIKDNSDDIHIIGIDRGERHLLYLTLINSKGEIVQQFSLNEIVNEYNGNTYKTNYHDLLDKREEARKKERESWKTIETIKELKEGYISQVVHKIAELMVQYNAIVVLEDLNIGFMRGRQKVEKSVYQKFEKMLIDKLNYMVDKKKSATELGGTLKALQLTNKFESFKSMGKQSGFLFYVPAWNTSKLDPVTGFVNLFDTRYENVEKAKQFFSKFDAIRYNSDKKYFEFVVKDYNRFSGKAEGTRQDWVICTYGNRIKTFRNPDKNSEWDSKEIILTNEFVDFFKLCSIEYKSNVLKDAILQQTQKDFFEKLLGLFRLTLQMRNSITGTSVDYLISPVADSRGVFFDSRLADDILPKDADANGAYNIARKGLILISRLKNIGVEAFDKTKRVDKDGHSQWLPNKDWLQYAQQKI